MSSDSTITSLAPSKHYIIPLQQHIGAISQVLVKLGDRVLKGQMIAKCGDLISASIHAPVSGIVTDIKLHAVPHVSGLSDECVFIENDFKEEWIERHPLADDYNHTSSSNLRKIIRHAGIVGLGGATFPTQIKLRANGKSIIHTLVINAAECEPYITCDDMLMRERGEQIVHGIEVAQRLLGATNVIVGIEDNKPEAVKAMQAAVADTDIKVKVVPTLYPSGDARRLVHLVLGQEVPHDKRSTEVGIQVFNVATVLALYRYFEFGEPALSRVVSMTGNVDQPQNFEVLFGTPLMHLVNATGPVKSDTSHYIMGGPMMGFNLPSEEVPITKAANCIIAASPTLFEPPPPAMPCIRCARCADACPVSLQPQELYWFAKADNFEKAQDYKLFDCIECGACSYVCPSDIPLVQYYRYAKSEIIALDKEKEAADIARERNEFRLARIEREKKERAAKHAARAQGAKAAKAAKEGGAPAATNKQAAIAAAIARAKAQKAAGNTAPKNTIETSTATKAEIEAIDARRTAVGLTEGKQAKIAAAIARAKAQKAAASAEGAGKATADNSNPVADDEKQAKIAAAIARAKAQKAAASAAGVSKATTGSGEPVVDAEKQAKIAAAIERAKAQKAVASKTIAKAETGKPVADEEKQAKIAAAIARAKAQKAAALKAKENQSKE
ncbi:MAG: electron transport complex subunit RsxC [Methylophilaceae bacterium]|nr:MAG: electron transport complex subunit RsxC [Methylophilaceae bacterium]